MACRFAFLSLTLWLMLMLWLTDWFSACLMLLTNFLISPVVSGFELCVAGNSFWWCPRLVKKPGAKLWLLAMFYFSLRFVKVPFIKNCSITLAWLAFRSIALISSFNYNDLYCRSLSCLCSSIFVSSLKNNDFFYFTSSFKSGSYSVLSLSSLMIVSFGSPLREELLYISTEPLKNSAKCWCSLSDFFVLTPSLELSETSCIASENSRSVCFSPVTSCFLTAAAIICSSLDVLSVLDSLRKASIFRLIKNSFETAGLRTCGS